MVKLWHPIVRQEVSLREDLPTHLYIVCSHRSLTPYLVTRHLDMNTEGYDEVEKGIPGPFMEYIPTGIYGQHMPGS